MHANALLASWLRLTLLGLAPPGLHLAAADVHCGGHRADTSSECPEGAPEDHEWSWCNGECGWDDGTEECLPLPILSGKVPRWLMRKPFVEWSGGGEKCYRIQNLGRTLGPPADQKSPAAVRSAGSDLCLSCSGVGCRVCTDVLPDCLACSGVGCDKCVDKSKMLATSVTTDTSQRKDDAGPAAAEVASMEPVGDAGPAAGGACRDDSPGLAAVATTAYDLPPNVRERLQLGCTEVVQFCFGTRMSSMVSENCRKSCGLCVAEERRYLALERGALCDKGEVVGSFAECKAAHKTLGVPARVHPLPVATAQYPHGCFLLDGAWEGHPDKLHFNAMLHGGQHHSRVRPVCRSGPASAVGRSGGTSSAASPASLARKMFNWLRRTATGSDAEGVGGRVSAGATLLASGKNSKSTTAAAVSSGESDEAHVGQAQEAVLDRRAELEARLAHARAELAALTGDPNDQALEGGASAGVSDPASVERSSAPDLGDAQGRPRGDGARAANGTAPLPPKPKWSQKEWLWAEAAQEVRAELQHAWEGYRKYAWGTDELRPITRKGLNTFGGVGASILDGLTTLWLMDLPKEFEEAAEFVERGLKFGAVDKDSSVFELTIRALGGLLGAHSLTGRDTFLTRARELADMLLPAFNTTSGMPASHWNLRRGVGTLYSCKPTLLAEAGSIQLEWRYLSEHTGDPRYAEAADGSFNAVQNLGVRGVLPVHLTPPNHDAPSFVASKFSTGGEADSYYEYLLKQWLQSPSEDLKRLFLDVMEELPDLVRPAPSNKSRGKAHRHALVMLWGAGKVEWRMEHLSCFVPGTIALGLMSLPDEDVPDSRGWLSLAEGLTRTCVEMWTSSRSGLAPEHIWISEKPPHGRLKRAPVQGRHSFLRPETIESLYYMYSLTGEDKYRRWGLDIFRAIKTHSRVPSGGYASVRDAEADKAVKLDEQHSFVIAETFKYLYLLFAPRGMLDLNEFVLNTEAHPLRRSQESRSVAPVHLP